MSGRARLLMCPPDHFEVSYIINPWMEEHVSAADASLALRQWQALRDTLAAHAQIEVLPPVVDLPDLVFTANAGLVHGDIYVPSRFRHAERRPEEPHNAAWFAAHGFRSLPLPEGILFEGAGDALFERGAPRLWFGHGHRSDAGAASALQALLDIEVIALRLVDPRFYHLDTCFCPLTGGYLLYYPSAFDEAAQAAIEAHIPAQRRIEASEADALAFACNAINIGNVVALNRATPELRAKLEKAGFSVAESDVSEFLKAGGAVKCLCLRLDEPPVEGVAAT